MREFLLLGHIFFAMVWFGGQIATQVLAVRARQAGPERMIEFMKDIQWLGNRLQGPAAVLVLLFGILLVTVVGWDFSLWIVLGLVGFVALLGIGIAYLTPQTRQIIELAEQHGAGAPDVLSRTRTVQRVARLDTLIMVAIVLDMIAKPGM